MARRSFSPEFQDFVRKNISSIEQIEVLLILRANPERDWTVAEISAILRSSPASVQTRLDALVARRLARAGAAGFRYCATDKLHAMTAVLEREYAQRRFSVIELIFSKASSAHSFADAFRLREEKDE